MHFPQGSLARKYFPPEQLIWSCPRVTCVKSAALRSGLSIALTVASAAPNGEIDFAKVLVGINAPQGHQICFTLDEARTRSQRVLGLMFRQYVPDDAGMVFEYQKPRYAKMWMENTRVALDMVFVSSGMKVVQIAQNQSPDSSEIITSSKPISFVIELTAGTTRRYDIAPGARVEIGLKTCD